MIVAWAQPPGGECVIFYICCHGITKRGIHLSGLRVSQNQWCNKNDKNKHQWVNSSFFIPNPFKNDLSVSKSISSAMLFIRCTPGEKLIYSPRLFMLQRVGIRDEESYSEVQIKWRYKTCKETSSCKIWQTTFSSLLAKYFNHIFMQY